MKRTDFYYDLPERLIAQTPIENRAQSRLLYLNRKTGERKHLHFYNVVDALEPGDCLVLNNSRVIPGRIMGVRDTGGAVEVLLLRELGEKYWECLTRPGRKARPGEHITFGAGLEAVVEDVVEGGNRLIRFSCDGVFNEALDRLGQMPLPPYIHEKLDDPERYQTVYSKVPGSAAAPTAGLHFTPELLQQLRDKGVNIAFVTLHVGLGTFRPVKEEEIEDHVMHEEYCHISEETAELINRTKAEGHRVICVGTTSCRSLEALAEDDGHVPAHAGWINTFIYPGYRFKCMDGMITNFHLPESTLIMLVSAFAGRENVLAAYNEAVLEEYRFFSFGDAMLIL